MKEKIANILNSVYFMIGLSIVSVALSQLELTVFAYAFFAIVFFLVVLTDADRSIFALLLLFGFITYHPTDFSEYEDLFKRNTIMIGITGILIAVIIIIDFFKRREKGFAYKNFSLYGLLLILGSEVLSLFNATENTFSLILMGIGQTVGYVIVFLYFLNSKNEDSQDKISNVAIVVGITVILQMVLHLVVNGFSSDSYNFKLGWANRNTIAKLLLIITPLSLFTYLKDQSKTYGLYAATLFFSFILITLSRGAYMSIAVLIIPYSIIIYKLTEDKQKLKKDVLKSSLIFGSFVVVLIISLLLGGNFKPLVKSKWETFFSMTHRDDIYYLGWDLFKQHPIFGVGAHSGKYYMSFLDAPIDVCLYHNYIFQAIASTGLLGIGALLFYIWGTLKETLRDNYYNLAVFLVIGIYLIFGLVDNTFYHPLFMIYLSILVPNLDLEAERIILFTPNSSESIDIS